MKYLWKILFIVGLSAYSSTLTAQEIVIHGIMYEIVDSCKVRVTMPHSYKERIRLYSGKLYIPDSILINNQIYYVCDIADSFRGCIYLQEVRLPDSLEYIISSAFADCRSLRHIELPNNISCIYANAFIGCKSLRSVRMPTNLRIIQESAFEGCTHLRYIDIPQNVIRIDDCAFCGCNRLREIYVYASIPPIFEIDSSNSFYGVNTSIPIHIPKGSKSIYLQEGGWSSFTNIIDDIL